MISISNSSLRIIILICACLSWQPSLHAESSITAESAQTPANASEQSTAKTSDQKGKSRAPNFETNEKFFDQVKQLQKLPGFTAEKIMDVTGLPLDPGTISSYWGRGDNDEILVSVSHSRDDKVTLVELLPPQSLKILRSDIQACFGKGKVGQKIPCSKELKDRHGYETMVKIDYKNSDLKTEFDVILEPEERLYSVSLYR